MPHMSIQPAEEAYAAVLAGVGATLPKRDPVDTRIIEQVRTGEVTYKEGRGIITDIKQVGGFPEYKGSPHTNLGKDGIANEWKQKHGFAPNDDTVASADADGDGYTNLEESSTARIRRKGRLQGPEE